MKLKTYGWVFIKTRAFNFQTTISKLRRYFKKFHCFFYHTKRSLRKVKGLHKTYYYTEVTFTWPIPSKKKLYVHMDYHFKKLLCDGEGEGEGASKMTSYLRRYSPVNEMCVVMEEVQGFCNL